jgi:hypothetical protein
LLDFILCVYLQTEILETFSVIAHSTPILLPVHQEHIFAGHSIYQ